MFKYVEPLYKNSMILTAQVLQEHTDYAYHMLQNAYMDYSDGIISGVDIRITDAHILVNPGLIKHNGIIYSLSKTEYLPYEHRNVQTFLRIRFLDAVECEGSVCYETELILSEDAAEFPYEMELGRFIASSGATLYKNQTDFYKLAVIYDNFDIRYVKYAAVKEPTVSPVVTTLFGKALLDKHTNDVYDVAFAMLCRNGQPVARENIIEYIQIKMHREYEKLSNEQIYREFEKILGRSSMMGNVVARQQPVRKVIVD